MSNQELAEELHEPIIGQFEKPKVYSLLRGNILGADVADMQLISKFSKGIRFYHGLLPSQIKKVLQLLMLFKNP